MPRQKIGGGGGPIDVAGNHICDGWIGDGRTGLMDGWGHFKGGDRQTHKEGREREREKIKGPLYFSHWFF